VVECKNNTINLTTRELLIDEKSSDLLGKVESINCGGNFVFQEFLKILEHKVGSSAINFLREYHPKQFQILKDAVKRNLMQFNGVQSKFERINFDLEGNNNKLKSYFL
jgi:hypothetical protein